MTDKTIILPLLADDCAERICRDDMLQEGTALLQVDDSQQERPAASAEGQSTWRMRGASAEQLHEWAPVFLNAMMDHDTGGHLAQNIMTRYLHGIHLNSMYSGMGGAEMAMNTILAAIETKFDLGNKSGGSAFYSACDIAPVCRTVLLRQHAEDSPHLHVRHVFGDIMERIPSGTLADLKKLYAEYKEVYEAATGGGAGRCNRARRPKRQRGGRSGKAAEIDLAEQLGKQMMHDMIEVLQKVKPNASDFAASADGCPRFENRGWCYKCRRLCRLYGPKESVRAQWPAVFRLVVAGTTCTTWSSMGLRRQWCAWSAVVFVVWCFVTLGDLPDAIMHECTQHFSTEFLELIFGEKYVISSFVFGPREMGFPCTRTRRYTLMLRRSRCMAQLCFELDFQRVFFRDCICTGHCFGLHPLRKSWRLWRTWQ